ncbi:MAG TPA: hypothetical protein VGD17_14810 [Chitinophagaceae bacterium]
MKHLTIISLALCLIINNGCAQSNKTKPLIGGACEGCEAIHESPVPLNSLSWVDTLPDYHEPGPKIKLEGIIYKSDGKTPAKDVVLYIYHTDQQGKYSLKGNESGWGVRHGYIRGWIKTNEKGEYRFYTLRPASYPNDNAPQHIHATILEPGMNEYWIDEFVFDDDPNLTKTERMNQRQRAGSGIVKLQMRDGIMEGRRNIVLGLNVPDYPK